MGDTLDRRSRKTRESLHAAFVELLLEQGYETLKVGTVADRANVGRSTFYEHYRTKHDLLRASIVTPFSALADLTVPAASTARVTGLLRHFREHHQVARVLLSWPTRPLLVHTLAGLVGERLVRQMTGNSLIPVEAIARQIAEAQLALVELWVAGRPAMSLDAAAQALKDSARALVGAFEAGSFGGTHGAN